jgi:PfaD family protein
VDTLGTAPLAALLRDRPDIQALNLVDVDVQLRLERTQGAARLSVQWQGGASHAEVIELDPDPSGSSQPGRPLFLPDPDSRIDDRAAAVQDLGSAIHVVETGGGQAWFRAGRYALGGPGALPLLATLAPSQPLGPRWLRDRLGIRANYVAGAMAGGIASKDLVIAMGQAGLLGFFGAGGLELDTVRTSLIAIRAALGDVPYGCNLLHNPVEPAVEDATVDLMLEMGCTFVSASAFMGLTPAVVRYRFTGATQGDQGRWTCANRVFAKISRPEIATHFLRPAPARLVDKLVATGGLTAAEGQAARLLPVADAITCEADSGGHTDHRPFPVVLPIIARLRDKLALEHKYQALGVRVAIGAAGGIGTPEAVLAAFTLGADYVLTGSINQCSPEAGTSQVAKKLLLDAGMADVADGAAPDMFEIGAHVQVLSRGTLWAARSRRLFDLYKGYGSWEEVPDADRIKVEKQILRRPFDQVWADTRRYWSDRDPAQVKRADRDSRHRMALVFRWYLGMGSRWARLGDEERKRDYQIWCGPSMGAFNDWVRGTALEPLEARGVVAIADALLTGAGVLQRARFLESQGVRVPAAAAMWRPGAG